MFLMTNQKFIACSRIGHCIFRIAYVGYSWVYNFPSLHEYLNYINYFINIRNCLLITGNSRFLSKLVINIIVLLRI